MKTTVVAQLKTILALAVPLAGAGREAEANSSFQKEKHQAHAGT
jgi:hypothetical protein